LGLSGGAAWQAVCALLYGLTLHRIYDKRLLGAAVVRVRAGRARARAAGMPWAASPCRRARALSWPPGAA